MNPDSIEEEELEYHPRISKKVILQQREDLEASEETVIHFYYDPSVREVDFGRTMSEFLSACTSGSI